ncbi:MAG: aldolase/citrate lyase family protein [Desulfovibrio fairfieldensis]
MTVHDIRALLARDKPTVGTWLQLPSTDVAELMARAGYDWVAVDMEHGSFGRTGLPDIFRAIECGGAAPFARLPEAAKSQIKSALEAGAQGLIFPMIESREQLDRAIDWSCIPVDSWRKAAKPRNIAAWAIAGPTSSARILNYRQERAGVPGGPDRAHPAVDNLTPF